MRSIIIFTFLITISQAKLIQLSCKEIQQFVDAHNQLRNKLVLGKLADQIPAKQLNKIVWDQELASKAAIWAGKNVFRHNPDKTVASKRFLTGENLYWYATTSKKKVEPAILATKNWAAERKNFEYHRLAPEDFGGYHEIGHYTQMIWAKTSYIGCAISQTKKDDFTNYLVVCNYGPAGNYIGEHPYEKGIGNGKVTCSSKNCDKPYGNNCRR